MAPKMLLIGLGLFLQVVYVQSRGSETCNQAFTLKNCTCEVYYYPGGRPIIRYSCDDRIKPLPRLNYSSQDDDAYKKIYLKVNQTIDFGESFFKENAFDEINIYGTKNKTRIDDNAFDGNKNSLKSLMLHILGINELPKLNYLQRLAELFLIGCKLKDGMIRKADVEKLPINLVYLSISYSYNDISSMEQGAFLRLTKLRWLNLHNNNLKSLPTKTLPDRIHDLNLNYNIFTKIPTESLLELPKGCVIRLDDNKITEFKYEQVAPLWLADHRLSLERNYYHCSCNMAWVPHFYSEHNVANKYIGSFGYCQSGLPHLRYKSVDNLTIDDFKGCAE